MVIISISSNIKINDREAGGLPAPRSIYPMISKLFIVATLMARIEDGWLWSAPVHVFSPFYFIYPGKLNPSISRFRPTAAHGVPRLHALRVVRCAPCALRLKEV